MWQWPALLPMLSYEDPDVKWCGVQCIGLALGGGDALTSQIVQHVLQPEDVLECALRWHTASAALAAAEATMFGELAGMGPSIAGEASPRASPGRKRKLEEATPAHGWPLPAALGYADVCGLELPLKGAAPGSHEPMNVDGLVMTPSMERNIRAFALALCVESPILLEGPPSSGKSALITHLANVTGNANGEHAHATLSCQLDHFWKGSSIFAHPACSCLNFVPLADMICIHLDDQTDSKTLMGAYICTSKPGEFVWQPGPLTQAVTRGSWVVIEDINLASAEVLATLLPLVERRTLHVPSRGEELSAGRGFQLIATVTSDPGALGAGAYGSSQAVKDFMGGLFHNVHMEAAAPAEQTEIIARLFPVLTPLVPHAMASVAVVQTALRQRNAGTSLGDAALAERVAHALGSAGLHPGEGNLGRYFSFRDLLKWARRMASVHGPLLKRALRGSAAEGSKEVTAIPIAVREAGFVEAADVLCAAISKHEMADKLLAALAAVWAVPTSIAEQYCQLAKPEAQLLEAEALIGRATLSVQAAMQAASGKRQSRFAQTGHAMRMMERVAVSVANSEPVLLVGETGTGKTTLVQELAGQVRAKLVVVNLSQQTDSSDLIGGFRPLQPADVVIRLLQRFIDLVRRTWQRGNNEDFLDRVVKMARKQRWQQLLKAYRTAGAKIGIEAAENGGSKEGTDSAASAREAKKPRRGASQFGPALHAEWKALMVDVDAAERSARAAEGGFAFGFSEGALVQAVREGWWLLLDEVNLAPAEALERIASLLEDDGGSITVAERGDVDAVAKHPHFRLFAAMNPATDAGKKDLPAPLRNRFTEIWVGEPRQREDLAAIVAGHLVPVSVAAPVDAVVDFYLAAKAAAVGTSILT